jgi:hypothetical protein
MNAIAAHKDELEKLLENLSGDIVVSKITFVALLDAYITRLDANWPEISAGVNPPLAQIQGELTWNQHWFRTARFTTPTIQLQNGGLRFSKDFARRPASKRRILIGNWRMAHVSGAYHRTGTTAAEYIWISGAMAFFLLHLTPSMKWSFVFRAIRAIFGAYWITLFNFTAR